MRLGLLGGSFNPIHNGHIALANAALTALKLDTVLFLPAANPPHKSRGLIPFEERLHLIEAALCAYPSFVASDLDRPTDTPNYTYYLIDRVRAEYPEAELFFLIGEDSLRELPTWFRYRELVEKVEFAVFTRAGRHTGTPSDIRHTFVPMLPVRVSSTAIRRRIHLGKPIDDVVPPVVANYLHKHPELYR
jgi:nicotinate-nucleotide adenylyltransferase